MIGRECYIPMTKRGRASSAKDPPAVVRMSPASRPTGPTHLPLTPTTEARRRRDNAETTEKTAKQSARSFRFFCFSQRILCVSAPPWWVLSFQRRLPCPDRELEFKRLLRQVLCQGPTVVSDRRGETLGRERSRRGCAGERGAWLPDRCASVLSLRKLVLEEMDDRLREPRTFYPPIGSFGGIRGGGGEGEQWVEIVQFHDDFPAQCSSIEWTGNISTRHGTGKTPIRCIRPSLSVFVPLNFSTVSDGASP